MSTMELKNSDEFLNNSREHIIKPDTNKNKLNYNTINQGSLSSLELGKSSVDLDKKDEESNFCKFCKHSNFILKFGFIGIIYSYFAWATYYQITVTKLPITQTACSGYGFLVILFSFITFGIFYSHFLKANVVPAINEHIWEPIGNFFSKIWYTSTAFYCIFFSGVMIFLWFDTQNDRYRLVPLSGIAVFITFGYLICPMKSEIPWKTYINGLVLQFTLGFLILKWTTGRKIFDCLGDKVTTFLSYAVNGAAFVYGDDLVYKQGVFAFKALATIYFLGFIINILYYYGIMQKVITTMGELIQYVLGTSICESVNCAANVFLGMTEAPLLLKPFLKKLTDSEIHSIMCCGFATVSGSVLAAYIMFGANAAILIAASVMASPSALVYSKLLYPETEQQEITKENIEMTESPYASVLDAASAGASDAVGLVLNIIAGVIACLSFVYFVNGVLGWMGTLVGYTDPNDMWSVTLIMGKLFIPISFLMGVPWDECESVAKLIGLKTMVNEFVAFQNLETLHLSEKSKTIATFAICGFANPGSVGIMISALGTLIPHKKHIITRLVFRAAVGGAITCFMTACVAGLLIPTSMTSI